MVEELNPIISRNFPPERNRVELGPNAKFRPTPILCCFL